MYGYFCSVLAMLFVSLVFMSNCAFGSVQHAVEARESMTLSSCYSIKLTSANNFTLSSPLWYPKQSEWPLWVQKAKDGDPYALLICGVARMGTQRGAELLSEAVNRGSFRAAFYLGDMYRAGNGVPLNEPKAIELYKFGADGGEPWCQYRLGMYYSLSKFAGTPLAQEGRRWLMAAALSGHPAAQEQFASLWCDRQDEIHWLRLSAQQGYFPAAEELSNVLLLELEAPGHREEAYKWAYALRICGYDDSTRLLAKSSLGLSREAISRAEADARRWWEAQQNKRCEPQPPGD